MRKIPVLLLTAMTAFAAVSTGAANLMACPDCEKPISKRAVSCPNCGCPGVVIATRAAEIERAAHPKSNSLRAMVDGETRWALPMMMEGRAYAILPLDNFLGFTALYFRAADTNRLLSLGRPEIAQKVPLVRFPINNFTNCVYWSPGGSYAHDGRTRPPTEITSLAGFSSSFSDNLVLPSGQVWQSVSPLVFREALRAINARQKGEVVVLGNDAPKIFKLIFSRYDKKDTK